ncbi:MAG: serine/threonine-protein phosphatase, partial [bacterium]|nr:serine/threonine-protein phosphatase [bacterium]
GGDFYDFIWLDDERSILGIAVADVAGKSMDAALTAVLTTGVVQAEARSNRSVAEVVAAANLPVYNKTSRSSFTALCFARLDLNAQTLTFTNAGLMEPLLKRGSEGVRPLKSVGSRLPLGILPDGEYKERAVQLQPGDLLLLLTDGIPDSQDPSMEFYGSDTLRRLLAGMETDALSAEQILEAVIADVRRFSG